HQLFRFSVEADYVHGVLGVVSMLSFEFSAVNVFLPFLPEQSLHLVGGEPEERLHMPLREENLGTSGKVVPRVGRKFKRREQEMQSRWIALRSEPCPFHQGIKADVHILWPIASDFSSRRENEMLLAFEP